MKILKFGGTSVGSIENIKRIIEIVRKEKEQGEEVVLVCSFACVPTTRLAHRVCCLSAYVPRQHASQVEVVFVCSSACAPTTRLTTRGCLLLLFCLCPDKKVNT